MNVFDNEVVLEYLEGSIIFRNIVTGENKNRILYSENDPNGSLIAEDGSVAFGPAGSWENISGLVPGSVWQLIGTGVTAGDGFLAPNEFWVDATQVGPGPTGREVTLIQSAIDLADVLFAPGIAIVIRLREGQEHAWAAASIVLPNRDITITAIGQVIGEEVDAAVAGRIRIDGAGAQLGNNAGATQRNFELRNVAVNGALLVHQGWNLTLREVVVDGFEVTVDQGGVGAVNPVRILLEDTSGDGARYAGDESVMSLATSNHNAPGILPTIVRANRCELQGVTNDATLERFFHLGNTGALFDGCTFNVKSESDTDGLWIGLASPCNIEFTASSIVGDFTGTGFVRPLFSSSGATPFVRFTGLSVDALDGTTGLPTPTWDWGTLTPQGFPAIGSARAPRAIVPGSSAADALIAIPGFSGLGAVTERVMSDLGVAVTGGRLVYGTAFAQHAAAGVPPANDTLTPFALYTQSVNSAGPLFTIPLGVSRVYYFSVQAVMKNSGAVLVGWTAGELIAVVDVDGGGIATIVGQIWTPFVGGDAMFTLEGDIFPAGSFRIRVRASDALGGQTSTVEVEMRILAV